MWSNMFWDGRPSQSPSGDETSMEEVRIETLESLSVSTLAFCAFAGSIFVWWQRQAIAVAKAVMWNSKLVILDEPTAAL